MNTTVRDVPRETSDQPVALQQAPPTAVLLAPGIVIRPLLVLQDDLESFDVNADDVEGQAVRAAISSPDSYQAGSDILSAIAAQLRLLEDLRVAAKKPADDYGRMVQKLVLPLQERFQTAKRTLETKMLAWRNAEEKRLRDAQDAIRKQQQEQADRLAAEARAQGNEKTAEKIEEMVASVPIAPPPKIGTPNVYGKTTAKRVYWLGDVHDPMEILRQVVAGKLPLTIVEFSKSGMNMVADQHIKSVPEADQVEKIHLGIKITKSEKLV